MEIVRRDDEVHAKFGRVYITTAYPGVVKAWHFDKVQTDNFSCLHGMIKLALYDNRYNSRCQTICGKTERGSPIPPTPA